MEIANGK
jgi:hypothetical protein